MSKIDGSKTRKEKIENLKAKKAQIEKQISLWNLQNSNAERKAETHVKAALGGAVLIALNDADIDRTFKQYLIDIADSGVQKSGLGREKFDALKNRLIDTNSAIAIT